MSGLRASLEGGVSLHVRDMSNLVKDKVFATDLSSVVFDQQSGHLILLSDESKLLIEMTDEGKVVSFRSWRGVCWFAERYTPSRRRNHRR